eukprot:jgi/Botrbrau1/15013/Bobra.0018s0111.1
MAGRKALPFLGQERVRLRSWHLGTLACLAPLLIIVFSVIRTSADMSLCTITGPRVDCGQPRISKAECEVKGCCWLPHNDSTPDFSLPSCFYPNNGASSYEILSTDSTETGLTAEMAQFEATAAELGPDLPRLSLVLLHVARDVLRISIRAAGEASHPRWEVPSHLLSGSIWSAEPVKRKEGLAYKYDIGSPTFGLLVERAEGGSPLIDSRPHRFIFKEQYLEFTTSVPPDSDLYGLGERTASAGLRLPRDGRPVALWARDFASAHPDENLYGSHPVLLEIRPDGRSQGLLLLSSNAMDAVLGPSSVSFRVVGGVLDLFIFVGPSPAAVMEQLTRVVGRPALPPLWALGFHQCKWGYRSVMEVRSVVERYKNSSIPLDVMWTDIDYMDGFRIFTLNPKTFDVGDMRDLISMLHSRGQHWVPIVDPGVKIDKGYEVYEDGLARNVFLKDIRGDPYVGMVWPGAVHFPDFLNPDTTTFWTDHLREFHRLVPFDGLWIDMNEPSNFCNGAVCEHPDTDPNAQRREQELTPTSAAALVVCTQICHANVSSTPRHGLQEETVAALSSLETPPYAIANGNQRLPLGTHTVPVKVSHHDGTLEYDAHSLYGLSEAVVTAAALDAIHPGRRHFILTRSSFPGTGAHAAHWTGDNAATWDDLRWSISSVLASGLAGIPFVGADICGFQKNTTEELCNRWISAGAFYPFARDHSDMDSGYQELYLWETVARAARRALGMRYRLLPYLYTAFADSAEKGDPVARPLFFEFPSDENARGAHLQWLLGSDILVSPVLYEGASSVVAYFPQAVWYSIWDKSVVDATAGGRNITLEAPMGEVPVHFRGGSIIPLQEAGLTVTEVHATPLSLMVGFGPLSTDPSATERCRTALAEAGLEAPSGGVAALACGHIYFDDGVSVQKPGSHHRILSAARVQCGGKHGTCSAVIALMPFDLDGHNVCGPPHVLPVLDEVDVVGLPGPLLKVAVKVIDGAVGSEVGGMALPVGSIVGGRNLDRSQVRWHPSSQTLEIVGLNLRLRCPHTAILALSSEDSHSSKFLSMAGPPW